MHIEIHISNSDEKLSMEFDNPNYYEIREEIIDYFEHLYDKDRYLSITIIVRKRNKRITKEIHGAEFKEAIEKIDEFLRFIFRIKEKPVVRKEKREILSSRVDWFKYHNILSQKEKILLIIRELHSNEWVSSDIIKREYEQIFGENIKLSHVSTYLARLYREGYLERRGDKYKMEYKLKATI